MPVAIYCPIKKMYVSRTKRKWTSDPSMIKTFKNKSSAKASVKELLRDRELFKGSSWGYTEEEVNSPLFLVDVEITTKMFLAMASLEPGETNGSNFYERELHLDEEPKNIMKARLTYG